MPNKTRGRLFNSLKNRMTGAGSCKKNGGRFLPKLPKMGKIMGGEDASNHVLSTYGNFNQQMAQLDKGNLLHAAGQPVAIVGGSCGVPLVQGGSALSQVAVPAVLLVANNRYGKTRKSMKKFKMRKPNMRFMKSRKFRGSRRSRSGKR